MDWLFDIIIVGFLAADALVIDYLFWRTEHMFTGYSYNFLLLATMAAWIVIFYGSFVEPQRIVVVEQTVDLQREGTDHIHAVLISDPHVGRYKGKRYIQRIVDTINEIQPDVVLLAGDFVMKRSSEAQALAPLQNISSVYPIYAVLGNHDFRLWSATHPAVWDEGNSIEQKLESFGVRVLRNEGAELKQGLWLAGAEEYWTKLYSVEKAVLDRPANAQTILMTHNPDIVMTLDPEEAINLVLAGHTHGGQIRLPLLGPVPNLPDELGRDYDRGLFKINDTQLFITSGIGESGPRARLFNPPEIVSLHINY